MAKTSENKNNEGIRLAVDKKDHFFGLMNSLNEMRQQEMGCDFIIKVEGKKIPVHRFVMMAVSDYFSAMFTHNWLENQFGEMEMKNVPYKIFKKCMDFIYTGDIFLLEEECEELLYVACMLELSSVTKGIAQFLQSRLDASSFFTIRRIANKYSLADLTKVCDNYALKNLKQIIQRKEFDDLEEEYIKFLITEGHRSEDSKMAIVLHWIKADRSRRKDYLIALTSLLNWQKISPGLKKYLADDEPLCYCSCWFMRLFPWNPRNYPSVRKRPPCIHAENTLVAFDKSSALRAYNVTTKNWTQMQVLHCDLVNAHRYTAVIIDSIIYVLLENKKAFRLNVEMTGAFWERISNMHKKHEFPSAVVVEDVIYVVGSHSMESYDLKEGQWNEILCDGISNCNRCVLVVYDNSLFTIGGKKNKDLSDVNRYSMLHYSWNPVDSLPRPRSCPAAAVCENEIYVAGGIRRNTWLDDFMSFDPRTNTWTQLSPMRTSRAYFRLCSVADQLYTVGCDYRQGSTIDIYDSEEKRWMNEIEIRNMEIVPAATVVAELPELDDDQMMDI